MIIKCWLLALVIYVGMGLALACAIWAARFGSCRSGGGWQFYLQRLGFPLAWRPSAGIYAAGFSLIAAPGCSSATDLPCRQGGGGIILAERLEDLARALALLSWA